MDNAISQPVSVNERIASLDVLRGVAILGILLMNIVSFGMIMGAYDSPLVYGDIEGIDWYVWLFLQPYNGIVFRSGKSFPILTHDITFVGRLEI